MMASRRPPGGSVARRGTTGILAAGFSFLSVLLKDENWRFRKEHANTKYSDIKHDSEAPAETLSAGRKTKNGWMVLFPFMLCTKEK